MYETLLSEYHKLVTAPEREAQQPVDCVEAFEVARRGLAMPLYSVEPNPFMRSHIDCESFAREWFAKGWKARPKREAVARDAKRYRWLRGRDLDTISKGGVFAGVTPDNIVLNEEDLDQAADEAINRENARRGSDNG